MRMRIERSIEDSRVWYQGGDVSLQGDVETLRVHQRCPQDELRGMLTRPGFRCDRLGAGYLAAVHLNATMEYERPHLPVPATTQQLTGLRWRQSLPRRHRVLRGG